MRRPAWLAPALLAAALVAPAARAATPSRVGGQFRYWSVTNHNDNRDWLAYWAPGPFHVLLEVWDYQRGEDHPVGRGVAGPRHLPAQDLKLVAEDRDLHVFGVRCRAQAENAEDLSEDHEGQRAHHHGFILPARRSAWSRLQR